MGWPMTIAAVAVTIAYVRRARASADEPAASPPTA